jgi:hypothetical protein
MNAIEAIEVEIDGSKVAATLLKEPIGQFTHWYVNSDNEPRFLILNEAQPVPMIQDLNDALTSAQASGRFMVAVFTIKGDVEKGDQTMQLHRVSKEFPYDAFEACKRELAKNLDNEYQPPQPLKMAELVKKASQSGVIEGSTVKSEDTQNDIMNALSQMNQQINSIEENPDVVLVNKAGNMTQVGDD